MSHPDDGVLQELLDGELAPADEAVVRAHIAGCAPCTTALAELKAVQLEADAMVSRLELDPPLARRVHPARRLNVRMLGLAASAVLVAGTSWLLLRQSTGAPSALRGESSSEGIVLPMPQEERQEVPATTPAAPPAKSRERKDLAKVAAGAGSDTAGEQAADARLAEAGKDVAAEQDAAAPAANVAPPPMAAAAPAASRLSAFQGGARAATNPISLSDAEQRFGGRVRTIAGLEPTSVEILPGSTDSLPAVRQFYQVDGVSVVLVQQALPARKAKAELPRAEATSKQLEAAPRTGPLATVRSWESEGQLFLLQGALPADSIDALMKRVR